MVTSRHQSGSVHPQPSTHPVETQWLSSRDTGVRHVVAALDHVEEAIVVLSADRRVQYLNRPAKALLDNGAKAVPLPSNAWKRLDQGLPWSGQARLNEDCNDCRLRIKVQHVHSFDGQPSLLIIIRDVTEVERLQSIADSVNLSDNLGHFLSGIRHELGNPVNSIKTALTVLGANLTTFPAEKVADYVDRVLGEVGRIEYLLRSLRSFTSHESVKLERVEVSTIVREVVALVRPSTSAGFTLLVDPAPATCVVADRRAVYQILLNLVSNAIEAQPDRSKATIRLEITETDEHVNLVVVDDGLGMSPKEMALAMRPFFTTKPTGTGLGLVIAQRLAENQGGRLRLHSTRGGGTRAVLSLARAPLRSERP